MRAVDYPMDFDATADNRSAQVIQVEAIGRGGIVILLATMLVALVFSMLAWGEARRATDAARAAETRAMDRANLAERESKLNTEQLRMLQVELEKQGIKLPPIH